MLKAFKYRIYPKGRKEAHRLVLWVVHEEWKVLRPEVKDD
jgi:hypothetical protein